MQNFDELNLSQPLKDALKAMGFVKPTPIQAQAIPLALQGMDLIGCAQTGTGKTAAFSIPMISHLLYADRLHALILAPTRELAMQIDEVVAQLTQFTPWLTRALLIGGVAIGPQEKALKKDPCILIATPGRLYDHLERRNVSLKQCALVVLDEADRMLDMGFFPQIRRIMKHLPDLRQTMLFSATMPPEIEDLARRFLESPERITIGGTVSRPAEKVIQRTVEADVDTKLDVLLDEIDATEGSVIIFARTKSRTDRVARQLEKYGYNAAHIHGDRSQRQRTEAIEGFRSGKYRILVATDIAARGLDIPHVTRVINFDLPEAPEDYIHRIGRTARAGAEGEAVSLITPDDWEKWMVIDKFLAARRALPSNS